MAAHLDRYCCKKTSNKFTKQFNILLVFKYCILNDTGHYRLKYYSYKSILMHTHFLLFFIDGKRILNSQPCGDFNFAFYTYIRFKPFNIQCSVTVGSIQNFSVQV